MRYLSLCSGIEAATAAWHHLGWTPVAFSEIEPFPAAVLKHHYPNVPNLGDMTKINGADFRGKIDLLVGGTPCQAFSVAGLRKGLSDARGNLTLTFVEIANASAPSVVLWENVPGVLSSKDNAFGCFLAGLAGEDVPLLPPGGKWTDAGFVLGPQRAVAWRVLDAQYFGLAQRRRRVFVVACPRDGADPREILFELEGVQRHSAPSREAGQGFAAEASGSSHWSGGPHPSLNQSARGSGGVGSSNQELFGQQGAYLVPGDLQCITGPVTHALKADGFDGSEDGTGRGQPIVCQEVADTITNCFHKHHGASGTASGRLDFETETFAVAVRTANTGADGPCHVAVAFQSSQSGVRLGDTHATLDSNNGSRRHNGVLALNVFGGNKRKDRPEGGFYVEMDAEQSKTLDSATGLNPTCSHGGTAVLAFHENQRAEVTLNDTVGSLKVGGGKPGQGYPAVAQLYSIVPQNSGKDYKARPVDVAQPLMAGGPVGGNQGGDVLQQAMQVRRLTPRECERLQGFPDDYTLIRWKRKPAEVCPDGPRYKALGNSMAVPCMRWLGERIDKYGR